MLVYQVNRMRLSVSLGKGQVRDNDKQLVSSFSVHRAVSCFTVFTAYTSILEIRKLEFIKIE